MLEQQARIAQLEYQLKQAHNVAFEAVAQPAQTEWSHNELMMSLLSGSVGVYLQQPQQPQELEQQQHLHYQREEDEDEEQPQQQQDHLIMPAALVNSYHQVSLMTMPPADDPWNGITCSTAGSCDEPGDFQQAMV